MFCSRSYSPCRSRTVDLQPGCVVGRHIAILRFAHHVPFRLEGKIGTWPFFGFRSNYCRGRKTCQAAGYRTTKLGEEMPRVQGLPKQLELFEASREMFCLWTRLEHSSTRLQILKPQNHRFGLGLASRLASDQPVARFGLHHPFPVPT